MNARIIPHPKMPAVMLVTTLRGTAYRLDLSAWPARVVERRPDPTQRDNFNQWPMSRRPPSKWRRLLLGVVDGDGDSPGAA